MRQAGIKKKTVQTRSCAARAEERQKEFRDKTIRLGDYMEALEANGEHILYLDEATFTARGYSKQAWSAPNTNIMINDPLQYQPCIAVIAAVCKCHGLWAWDM